METRTLHSSRRASVAAALAAPPSRHPSTTVSPCWPSPSPAPHPSAKRQAALYARRTPQNSGNAAFTMSLISDRNAVGWNNCPSGMHGKVSSARI